MYKIMTKLHTSSDDVFRFYSIINDEGLKAEYAVMTREEAAEQALKVLEEVGSTDLRIVDDQPYYLDLIYGVKPIPEPNLYKITIVTPEGCIAEPDTMEDIVEGSTVQTKISFNGKFDAFHLIIDEKEYKTGLPVWVKYEEIDDYNGVLTFMGITRDHNIEIIVDNLVIAEEEYLAK